MSEQCGIGLSLIENFRERIPNAGEVRFDSVLHIDTIEESYDIRLEQYGIEEKEVREFMKARGCNPLEDMASE